MGKPVPGYDVALVDNDGQPVETGEIGNIAIRVEPDRPVGIFHEYWRDPDATETAFRHGLYFTGDQAHVDHEGYFWFSARADDVIISAGYRIGPFEVESAIMEHPVVAETAVIGVPDTRRGEVVKAFVVLKPGTPPSDELTDEIQEFVKQQTAPYKYPRQIEFVTELPKTVSGKIRRIELRQAHQQDSDSG
jgi:acyl-coenzyme A synthetase/AMP-(fatty) acid ligase